MHARGIVYGGVLDTHSLKYCSGLQCSLSTEPPMPIVTASQTVAYVGKAKK